MYITGPCLIIRNGVTIYTESGLKSSEKTKTGEVKSDLHGKKIDTYMISRMVTMSAKPVDAIANLPAFFGLGLGNIGGSIFTAEITAIALISISLANPGVGLCAAAHNLGPAGTTIAGTIAGVAGSIAPAGVNAAGIVATVIDATHFSIGLNVTHAGTGGTFTPVSVPLQIVSKNDAAIYTYERSGILKAPGLHLGASKGFFSGDMQWAALGSVTKVPTDPAFFKSAVAAAFTDSAFDETKIKRYRYTAAYGDDADFAAMTGQTGFDVAIEYGTGEIPDDNVGIADIILESVTAGVKFIPSNLTEALIDELVNLQDTEALQPGDSVAGDGSKALVIAGADNTTGFTATLNGAGFSDRELMYATGKLRAGEVQAITRRTWTAGAANSLFTFATT